MPLSSILFVADNSWVGATKNNKKMIKDCLIINCTGKDDTIALKVNNKFFLKKLQTNIIKYEALSRIVLEFTKEHKVEIEQEFSILVNSGPGSFSGIRIALAVSKGIQLVKKSNIYSYNSFIINAAPYLKDVETLISIIKTNKFYYYSEGSIGKNSKFTAPKKMEPGFLKLKNSLVVVSQELENDEIIKNIGKKKVCIAKIDLKNIDILIENNLLENKLIKPLYLS